MHEQTLSESSSRPQSHSYRRSAAVRVRWGALAVGSTVGIATWATLYVWGAAVMCLTGVPQSPAYSMSTLLLGLYGGLAASAALWLGSAVAARAAGATSRQAGVLHGLAMWGMANITLVLVVGALGMGFGASLQGPFAYVVHVGAAAASGGGDVMGQNTESWSAGYALLGMGLVMLTSLALSVWGGLCGVLQPTSDRI